MAPRPDVEIETLRRELGPVALVLDAGVHEVAQATGAAQLGEREADVALRPRVAVVDRDDEPTRGGVPRTRDEPVGGRVSVPRRQRVEQRPLAVPRFRTSHAREEAIVERLDLAVDRLRRSPPEVVRRADPSPGTLALVDEA